MFSDKKHTKLLVQDSSVRQALYLVQVYILILHLHEGWFHSLAWGLAGVKHEPATSQLGKPTLQLWEPGHTVL